MVCDCVEAAELGLVEAWVAWEVLEGRELVVDPWLIEEHGGRDAYLLEHTVLHEASKGMALLCTLRV